MSKEGNEITVIPTTTIKAKYAYLPVVSTRIELLVQVTEPVPQIISKKSFNHIEYMDKDILELLKDNLLNEWHDHIKKFEKSEIPDWMLNVDNVELIECELLVPKGKNDIDLLVPK